MRKLIQNKTLMGWIIAFFIYAIGCLIFHTNILIYVCGWLSGEIASLIKSDLEDNYKITEDICKTCADSGHCEWWCNGKSYTLSDKYKEISNG